MVVAELAARRSTRLSVRMPVVVIDSHTGQPDYAGVAMDSSPGGFRFQCSFCSLAPNQTVEAILMGEPSCLIRCRVAWVGSSKSGHYGEVGFEILGSSHQAAA